MNNYAEIWFHEKPDEVQTPNYKVLSQKIHSICGKRVECTNLLIKERKIKNNDIDLGGDTIIHQDGIPRHMTRLDIGKVFMQLGEVRQVYIVNKQYEQQQGVVQFYSHKIAKILGEQKSIMIDGYGIQIQTIEEVYNKAKMGHKFNGLQKCEKSRYNFPLLDKYRDIPEMIVAPEIKVTRVFIGQKMYNNAQLYCDVVFPNQSAIPEPQGPKQSTVKKYLRKIKKRNLEKKALQMEDTRNVGIGSSQNNKSGLVVNFSENEFPDLNGNISQSNTLKIADDQLLAKKADDQLLKKADDKSSKKVDGEFSKKADDHLSEKPTPFMIDDKTSPNNKAESFKNKISFVSYSFKNGAEIPKNDFPELISCEKPSGNISGFVDDEILKDSNEVKNFSHYKKKQDDSCSKRSIIRLENKIYDNSLSAVSNYKNNSIGQCGKNNSFRAIGKIENKLSDKKEIGTLTGQNNCAINSPRNFGDFKKLLFKKETGALSGKNNGANNSVRNFEDFLKFSVFDKNSPNRSQKEVQSCISPEKRIEIEKDYQNVSREEVDLI